MLTFVPKLGVMTPVMGRGWMWYFIFDKLILREYVMLISKTTKMSDILLYLARIHCGIVVNNI